MLKVVSIVSLLVVVVSGGFIEQVNDCFKRVYAGEGKDKISWCIVDKVLAYSNAENVDYEVKIKLLLNDQTIGPYLNGQLMEFVTALNNKGISSPAVNQRVQHLAQKLMDRQGH